MRAKYATVYDEAATIAKVNDVLYVIYDDGRIEPFEVEMAPFTVVLGDVATARPERNGRCTACWAFFRSTGTDRTPAELAVTKGHDVASIMSKGLLRDVSTKAEARAAGPAAAPIPVRPSGGKAERPGKLCAAGCGTMIYGKTVTICAPCWKAGKRQAVTTA
jgi:hypothetical protein